MILYKIKNLIKINYDPKTKYILIFMICKIINYIKLDMLRTILFLSLFFFTQHNKTIHFIANIKINNYLISTNIAS